MLIFYENDIKPSRFDLCQCIFDAGKSGLWINGRTGLDSNKKQKSLHYYEIY
ncbi:hypothetical protein AB8U03_12165 [Clostridium sp. Mt-5]|uniref:Uncharacterized protein n=1 Tax=Clostridium moutaii TaxID=3240932 RepID=A0ABV4BQ80_9CLOT